MPSIRKIMSSEYEASPHIKTKMGGSTSHIQYLAILIFRRNYILNCMVKDYTLRKNKEKVRKEVRASSAPNIRLLNIIQNRKQITFV